MAAVVFNKAYAGYVYTGFGTAYHRWDNGSFSGVEMAIDNEAYGERVVCTGFTTTAKDGSVMLQYEGADSSWYNWLDLTHGNWKRGEMADLYSQSQAQNYVNKMIENNKQILMNNLFCARFSGRLTAEEKQTLYELQANLDERNKRLQNDGFVTGAQVSDAYGYNALNSYLVRFMQNGVGLVVSTTAIIISCVVIASLATAAYFAYKYYYEQSAKDVKYSDKLTKTLMAKLTAEEYNQLMSETKGLVTKATMKARLGSTFNLAKYAVLAVGAYALYNLLTTKTKRNGSKTRLQSSI